MNIRSFFLTGIVLFLSVCIVEADKEFRTFESQGRNIEARIISVNPKNGLVELQLKNKKRKRVKPSIFCEADQNYIRDWLVMKEFKSGRFKIEPVKTVLDQWTEMVGSHGAIRRINEVLCYDVKISNRTGVSIKGLQMEYNIYFEQEKQGHGENVLQKKYVNGVCDIEALESRQNTTVKTEKYKIYNQRLGGGYDYYTDGTPTNQSGKSKGIWIKVHLKTPSGLTATREICLPQNIKKQYRWREVSS